jgi:hypothetical protein
MRVQLGCCDNFCSVSTETNSGLLLVDSANSMRASLKHGSSSSDGH